MAPTKVDPDAVLAFKDAKTFAKWFKASHAKLPELWLKLAKADSGIASVTYAEALDEALCWGWIDGQKKELRHTILAAALRAARQSIDLEPETIARTPRG